MAVSDYSTTPASVARGIPPVCAIAAASQAPTRDMASSWAGLCNRVLWRESVPFWTVRSGSFPRPVSDLISAWNSLFDWGRIKVERLTDRPTRARQPTFEHAVFDAENFGRPYKRVGGSVVDESVVVAPVAVLRLARGPRAVLRAVSQIIVDALDRVASRPLAHVGYERRKRVPPPLTDANASGAIVPEGRFVWVFAPTDHAHEHRIERVLGSSISGAF